jgi:Spy/CpxP family protein refolding chaperone
MKKSKWFTGVAVLALSSGLALAAPHGDGYGRRGQGAAFGREFAQKLNLTDAQKAQIKDITTSFREQNKATFESLRPTMMQYHEAKKANDTAKINELQPQFDAARTQMRQLRDQLDAKISTVLTPEQNAQWQQLKADRAAKRQQWEQKKQNQ